MQSTVYREEQRDVAIGERIRFADSDRDAGIRSGDFATVVRVGVDNALYLRLDNGKSVELDYEAARHIEYGYAVETAQRTSADRVLVTGDAPELAQQREALTRLSMHTRDLGLYTSDSRELAVHKATHGAEIAESHSRISPPIDSIPTPTMPGIEIEEFGRGL
jgi:hypothetical protein